MNVLMAGVGGQGIILASDILSELAMRAGFDVKKSEIHGMAQRGGSVMSHVRFSDGVASPLIPYGACDILVSFEELEAARYMVYFNGETRVLVNRFRLAPPSVIAGKETYPDVVPLLKDRTAHVHMVEASRLADALGNPRTLNIVLMGALSTFLEPSAQLWEEVIKDMLPERIRDVNLEAFRRGRALDIG
jgi:indolepyruvate ferredoxin oxidoreductase beta subunit